MQNCLIVGTYPPRKCGIATFSNDLRNNLKQFVPVSIAAVNNYDFYDYSDEVVFQIDQEDIKDYIACAAWINQAAIDLVIIQHEYGIFGGPDGKYLIALTNNIKKPFIIVTHTVLPEPSANQKTVLATLAKSADWIICMTGRASGILKEVYQVDAGKISVIPHGVPAFRKKDRNTLKVKYGFTGRRIITTFGLIGPGKGLEIGLKALSYVVPHHPEVLYIIAGKTHPNLLKSEGERYRNEIKHKAKELGLEANVLFVNRFLTDEELGDYLYMTDIYLSPYPNLNQAVSGTLSFAAGCGRCIISTPYEHALELLGSGRGLIANKPTPEDLAELLGQVLGNPQLQMLMEKKAAELGDLSSWAESAKMYYKIAQTVAKGRSA